MKNPHELPDLTALHVKWQGMLNAMIEGGAPYGEAAEAMFTVAVVAKTKADGRREAARTLFLVAAQLTAFADLVEADAAAPRH
jgi:hypothetical protein